MGFDKLVKLQLDNNIIEKIENLGHLGNLEVITSLALALCPLGSGWPPNRSTHLRKAWILRTI